MRRTHVYAVFDRGLADQPYAYWRLNETAGTVAVDASGHARNGAYQPGAQLANGTLLRSSSTRYVMLGGAANAYIDVSAATAFCASGAWSIECWASIASYANAAGANGRYAGTAGVRFIGNTTWTGGSSRQPGLEWGVSYSDSGKDTRWQNAWLRDYQSMNAPQGSAPVAGTVHHFVVAVISNQTGWSAAIERRTRRANDPERAADRYDRLDRGPDERVDRRGDALRSRAECRSCDGALFGECVSRANEL